MLKSSACIDWQHFIAFQQQREAISLVKSITDSWTSQDHRRSRCFGDVEGQSASYTQGILKRSQRHICKSTETWNKDEKAHESHENHYRFLPDCQSLWPLQPGLDFLASCWGLVPAPLLKALAYHYLFNVKRSCLWHFVTFTGTAALSAASVQQIVLRNLPASFLTESKCKIIYDDLMKSHVRIFLTPCLFGKWFQYPYDPCKYMLTFGVYWW